MEESHAVPARPENIEADVQPPVAAHAEGEAIQDVARALFGVMLSQCGAFLDEEIRDARWDRLLQQLRDECRIQRRAKRQARVMAIKQWIIALKTVSLHLPD